MASFLALPGRILGCARLIHAPGLVFCLAMPGGLRPPFGRTFGGPPFGRTFGGLRLPAAAETRWPAQQRFKLFLAAGSLWPLAAA
jgi:hypothetical protein